MMKNASKNYIIIASIIIVIIIIFSFLIIKPFSSKNCALSVIKSCLKYGRLTCITKINLNGTLYYINATINNPGKPVPICCIKTSKVVIPFSEVFVFYKGSYYGDEIPTGTHDIIIAFNTTCSNITSLTIHLENGQSLQLNLA
ncbi:hypothetical protein [Acidianus sp. HS-5]|uniref:hypothetical protein n=1 Tax=Acidianus sp. HS-5 TaxID=2886040 RepID=UPI001F1DA647|nr:hypothetical protein [Acidianus sp. HS-5]